jgi:hypothetical protein
MGCAPRRTSYGPKSRSILDNIPNGLTGIALYWAMDMHVPWSIPCCISVVAIIAIGNADDEIVDASRNIWRQFSLAWMCSRYRMQLLSWHHRERKLGSTLVAVWQIRTATKKLQRWQANHLILPSRPMLSYTTKRRKMRYQDCHSCESGSFCQRNSSRCISRLLVVIRSRIFGVTGTNWRLIMMHSRAVRRYSKSSFPRDWKELAGKSFTIAKTWSM